MGVPTAGLADPDVLGAQVLQTRMFGELQDGRQPRARHEFGIIEERGDAMADAYPTDLLCAQLLTFASHMLSAQQGIRATRPAARLKRTGGSLG